MSGAIGFALRFLLLFALLFAAFEALRGTDTERFVVDGVFVMPAASLVNVLTPDERVTAGDRALVSDKARLRVLRGCEGVETVLLVVAAVLAYPAPWRRRVVGVLIGAALAYGLGVLRLAFLYLGLRFWPAGFQMTHGVIAPLMPVALLALFFLAWSGARTAATPAT